MLLPFEMKHAYAISESSAGKLYQVVKPSDLSKDGGSSAVRCVRQVYNYMDNNGEEGLSFPSVLRARAPHMPCESSI